MMMLRNWNYSFIIFLAIFLSLGAKALEKKINVKFAVTDAISQSYPGAWIEILNEKDLESELKSNGRVEFLNEDGVGNAYFNINGKQAKVNFSAWIQAPVAVRRISPLEKLSAEMFSENKVDLSRGSARPYRGLILSHYSNWADYESKQTIPAGAFVTSNMVSRVPDIRRGDAVQVLLKTGSLTLLSPGVAQEPGSIGDRIRVLSRETKKEMTGVLVSKTNIEVSL